MSIDLVKQFEAAKADVAKLEVAIKDELTGLPAVYGFTSVEAFVAAVCQAAGVREPAGSGFGRKKRFRAKITDVTRRELKKLVAAGKTGSAIAKELGISLPSVQNIKRDLGLIRHRR